MLKIIHFNTYAAGGSAVLMARLHRSLRDQGYDSRVRFRHGGMAGDSTAESLEYCGHPIDRFLERARYSAENRMLGANPASYFSRMRLHRPSPFPCGELDCDIVHLHWVGRWLDLPSFLAPLPTSVPIVWTVHDMHSLAGGCFTYSGCDEFATGCKKCPLLPFPFNRLLAAGEFRRRKTAIAKRRIWVVGNSDSTTGMARRSGLFTGAEKIVTIHPGLTAEKFVRHPKAEAKRRLGIAEDALTLGFGAAALTDRNKGIHRFFEVVGKLYAPSGGGTGTKVAAVLFGDGEPDCPVAGLPVHHLGKLDAEGLSLAFSAMDVFLVTSKMETFGQVAIEAQACGTPVWAFDVGGLADAIDDGKTGCLVPFPDTGAMAGSIRKAHEDGGLAEMGERAATWGGGNFTVTAMAERYLDLYREALGLA